MPEWLDNFEHDSLDTPEVKESFAKTMSKYETPEAAIVGGFNAIKSTGTPYKLPESLDKMPGNTDEERDKNRNEMMGHISKLIGAVEKPEDLQDIDWLLDSTLEGDKPNEELVKAVTELAVAEKAPKGLVQKLVGFWNRLQAGYRAKQRAKQTEVQKQAEVQQAAKIKEVNEKLTADAGGNAEELKSRTELVKRMFLNFGGLTAEEYEQAGAGVLEKANNYAFNKALINLAQNFKSGKIMTGDGNPPPPPPPKKASNISNSRQAIGLSAEE